MNTKKILDFWFKNEEKWFSWWEKFDQEIKENFLQDYKNFTDNFDFENLKTKDDFLASIILVDQFSRNIFRWDKKSFKYDFLWLFLAKWSLKKFGIESFSKKEKSFILLPLMHSESLEDQKKCEKYFKKLAKEDSYFETNVKFAKDHKNIISLFSRFPHRNEVLGRKSTSEEKFFLKHHKWF